MRKILNILLSGCCALIVSCTQKSFEPVAEANPWADNYLPVSTMGDYKKWGTYNVHDPSCQLFDSVYYMYSTDAVYNENRKAIEADNLPFGYIQVRKSKNLVDWEFVGWAFDEIPREAKEWVLVNSGGKGATNIWAPYILKHKGKYRLYYSVSAFGMQTSYIGLAESDSPEGPWELKGCVVKTKTGDTMNAIDPSIVTNPETGEQWMHYGSYFGGLHCVQLDPETGLTLNEGDQGHLTARRFNGKKNNIEAPEIIYNPESGKYFLFVSYDPLMTTYNVRVGVSDRPEGPFVDFYGADLRDETDNYPILTYPYQFSNHPGWAGTGHCCVFSDEKGKFYMAHQARLAPENHLMDLHLREIYWTPDGWPAVSPQRYTATAQRPITENDIIGEWEVIVIHGDAPERDLEAGQILWGENHLREKEMNHSKIMILSENGRIENEEDGGWEFVKDDSALLLNRDGQEERVQLFFGHDWENEKQTILFTGLNGKGYSLWGKRVK